MQRALALMAMICLTLAWLVSNHYPPWSSFYNESAAALGLLLLALSVPRAAPQGGAPSFAVFVAAVSVIPWVQWLTGLLPFSGDAWIASAYLLGIAVAIAVGFQHARAENGLSSWLATSILVAGLASSVLGLMQALDVLAPNIWTMDAVQGTRAYGNLGQPNNLATLIGWAGLALLLLREQGRVSDRSSAAALLVLILGVSATQSRTALLFGPVVLFGLFITRHRVPRRSSWLPVVAATALQWSLTLALPAVQTAMGLSQPDSLIERGVQSGRLKMWSLLLDALAQSPWQGFGWLHVGEAQLLVAERHPPTHELWFHAHNLFLDLLLWCGVPVGLLLSGLLAYWFISRAMRVRTMEAFVGWLVLAVLGAHSMLELPHHYAYFLIPAGLWIGVIEHSIGSRAVLSAKWSAALAMFSFCLLVALLWDYSEVEEDFRLMRFESLKIGSVHAVQPAPSAHFLSSLTAYLRFTRTTPVAGMSAAEMAEMDAVVKRYPYPLAMSRFAIALALNERPEEARKMFIKIRSMYDDEMYTRVRQDLHERAAGGSPELLALDASVPN